MKIVLALFVTMTFVLCGCGVQVSAPPAEPSAVVTTATATATASAVSPSPTAPPLATATATMTPAPLDLATYTPLIKRLQETLARRDRNELDALLRINAATPGLYYGDWGGGRSGEPRRIGGTSTMADTFFDPPLRVSAVVSRGGATGVLLENWRDRAIQSPDQCDSCAVPLGTSSTVWIPGAAVVLVFHYEGGYFNSRINFFGLAPANGFVKVADIPQ